VGAALAVAVSVDLVTGGKSDTRLAVSLLLLAAIVGFAKTTTA
jgi:hypothetical protein